MTLACAVTGPRAACSIIIACTHTQVLNDGAEAQPPTYYVAVNLRIGEVAADMLAYSPLAFCMIHGVQLGQSLQSLSLLVPNFASRVHHADSGPTAQVQTLMTAEAAVVHHHLISLPGGKRLSFENSALCKPRGCLLHAASARASRQ